MSRVTRPGSGSDVWQAAGPIVVGAGERLFGQTSGVKPMRLVDTRTVGDSLVLLTYQPVRPDRTR